MYTVLAWSPCVGHFYLLRAAMKMANIDSVFDFMFTSPKEKVSIILYSVIEGFKFNHVTMYVLRPDSQPLTRFETGRPVSKRVEG